MLELDMDLGGVLAPKTVKTLAERLEVRRVGDLLRHYPRRYLEPGELSDVAGMYESEYVTLVGEVVGKQGKVLSRQPGYVLEVTVRSGDGRLVWLSFFTRKGAHFPDRDLRPGTLAMFAGKISFYGTKIQLSHPEYELFDDAEVAGEAASRPIPVYRAVKGLTSWAIRAALSTVLDGLGPVEDPLPSGVQERHKLIALTEALDKVHRPHATPEAYRARHRLKWDEAFGVQVALAQRRRAAMALPAAPRPARTVGAGGLLEAFDAKLPFTLTEGQRQVGVEISAELGRAYPMHRLLQGDVSSGKTVVALRAMLQTVDAGGQAVLLAPTEVLAQQHHRSILNLLGPLGRAGQLDSAQDATAVALLTGTQGAKTKREMLAQAACGEAGIVVGTHALLSDHVTFADLGLIVVDEQHRFGVEQRDALRTKVQGGRPHVLVMTATPIPRTVAMTVFGDLDISVLTQLPAGRAPISTHVVPATEKPVYLERAWQRISEEAAQGRQIYIVCPRIGDNTDDDGPITQDLFTDPASDTETEAKRPAMAVQDLLPALEHDLLKGLRIGVLHGRLHPDDKDAVMTRFTAGDLDVLLATTVIEVGVDVPNATIMMIMDADRFGVSQLHQLRGRVGRGGLPGLCLLVTDTEPDSPSRTRLNAVAATTDGFELSRLDLAQRREGDVLGTAQSGRSATLRLLTLAHDEKIIGKARDEATALIADDPDLAQHPVLAAAMASLLDENAEYLEKT